MQRLFEFLLRFKDQFVLILLVILANLMILSNQNSQINFLRAASFGFFAVIEEQLSFFSRYLDAIETAEGLRQENMLLSEEVYRLRTYRIENLQLRKDLGLKEGIGFSSVPADVIHSSIYSSDNTITITAGSEQGVLVNNLVRNSSGVIGRVILTDNQYSIVQLMISSNFRMGAKVERTSTEGLITWDGKATSHVYLSNVVQTSPVEKGDPVVSSQNSTFAPEGIPVGFVDSVFIDPKQLFKTIRVRTAVDFSRVNHVFVTIPEKPDSVLLNLDETATRGEK
ncbi:MAG: rod shape-determining protein MreC [Bacteroidetes bacterium]|nr:rod shape-determining protein MreC [Bacteroidota bacterium]